MTNGLTIAGALMLALAGSPAPVAPVTVVMTARHVQPGELVRLAITTAAPVETLRARAFDRDLLPYRTSPTRWDVLVGIDLDVAPGAHDVAIAAGPPLSTTITHQLTVTPRQFPTRRLTVAPAFVNPPAAARARIDRDAQLLNEVWARSAPAPRWTGAFTAPVRQPANSAFGSRSVFNGEPRAPHGGADFASPLGTRVRAPGAGRVVLARPLYYTGNTVVLDHGVGVFSLFAHLAATFVTEGTDVAAREVLGTVGATGRVTGPHLHWAVRANGARIDPLSLMAVLGPAPRP